MSSPNHAIKLSTEPVDYKGRHFIHACLMTTTGTKTCAKPTVLVCQGHPQAYTGIPALPCSTLWKVPIAEDYYNFKTASLILILPFNTSSRQEYAHSMARAFPFQVDSWINVPLSPLLITDCCGHPRKYLEATELSA